MLSARILPRLANVAKAVSVRALHSSTNLTGLRAAQTMGTQRLASGMFNSMNRVSKRYLNLHEFQAKDLMASYGVRVQRGKTAETPEEALSVAEWLKNTNAKELICKAQIHAGGRGKGTFTSGYKGGVQICSTPEQIQEAAKNMIGGTLVTKQTGPAGQVCKKVLVHEGIFFNKEFYFAILMDRAAMGPVIVASTQGGMDIEEVAEKHPEQIFTEPINIFKGIQPEQTLRVAKKLGFSGAQLKDAQEQMTNLYKLFIGTDATQVEINPFVVTLEGKVFCVDAKINFDDNASFRQGKIYDMRDITMEDPREVAATKFNLNYIGLDGNIGCMVNGAGLAMATMDIIKLYGGEPANFLDVGGGANEKQVEEAFKILTADPSVKVLFVNIFGGIMKCDIIATGIINAAKKLAFKQPLVVRLAGTNVEKGNTMLKNSGLKIVPASDMDDGAQKAVAALKDC